MKTPTRPLAPWILRRARCLMTMLALLTAIPSAILRGADDLRPVVDESKAALQTVANASLPTLYVVGDSTARSNSPLRGWGSEIGAFFDSAKINVVNQAIGGRSSRTYITEGRWDKVLATVKPGDFVLIQFGHNDVGNPNDPKAKGRPSLHGEGEETAEALKADLKTVEPVHSFGWYMRKFATDTKAKGATPILLSMVPHKDWKDGKIVCNEQATFVQWTQNAAKATGALYIDANTIIARGLERLGPEKVNALFGDQRTHSTPEGAAYNAAAVVVGLKALTPDPLANDYSPAAASLPPTLTAP